MKAMESPLPCLPNQPSNSSHTNTPAIESDSVKQELNPELKTCTVIKEELQCDSEDSKQLNAGDNIESINAFSLEEISNVHIKNEPSISNEFIKSEFEGAFQEKIANVKLEAGVSETSPSTIVKQPANQTAHRETVSKPVVVSQRSRDLVEKKHKCQFCEKSFACGYSLTRHVRIHTGEQCYKCDVCSKIFTTRSSKIRHDRTHISEGTYKCEFCNKIFKRPILLTEHQVEHTGQKPFACGVCGKAFTKQFQLASHLKTHNPKFDGKEGQIELCELCGQGFPEKDSLIEHLKEHVAEKALQSDLVDSSNDLEATLSTPDTPVTPFRQVSQLNTSEEKDEDASQTTALFGTTVIADKDIVDAQLPLESNIIYIVGEDGTLQPQINYDLVTQSQFESQQSASFIEAPMDTDSVSYTPITPDVKPESDTCMDITESSNKPLTSSENSETETIKSENPIVSNDSVVPTSSPLIIPASPALASGSPLVVTDRPVVTGESASLPSNSALVTQPSTNSLVIAQADTTSLDSLKTDDEDSPSPSLVEGDDILAIACKEILIVPTVESENIKTQQTEIDHPVSNVRPNSAEIANMLTPDKKFHCQYCDKSFTQRNNLDSHTRTHTKEKPFKCAHCDMCFSQRWSLTRHVRIHTGEKPFKCAFCGAAFRVKGEKTEHEKANHMNERNERIAQQARMKGQSNGSEISNRIANDTVCMEMIEITPQKEFVMKREINTNNSNFPESSAQSMSQTDDSDSKSDYESIQSSSQYGDDMKFSIESSQDNFMNHVTALSSESEIKFHYGSEEYMDTMTSNEGPVLTTLNPAEFIMDEKAYNHHCDFCESSFATRTELVQHFSTHTG